MRQANGRFTIYLANLRDRLIEFASLLELELDFSEEEVEFADRKRLRDLADELLGVLHRLAASYSTGRSLKDGVPVVIAGAPNAGKSTLLNQLLEEEKAIVSDVPGTTRDIIEDTCEVNGILFRFIDTAGLRDTADIVERIGIERAEDRLSRASIILWLLDTTGDTDNQLKEILNRVGELPDASHLLVCNKVDLANNCESEKYSPAEAGQGESLCGADAAAESLFGKETAHLFAACMSISASEGYGIDELKGVMTSLACKEYNPDTDIILTNGRHYAAILRGAEALSRARAALDTGLSADFIAQDVRETLHHLATLTGTISTPDLLASIFSRFCIGK